MIGVVRNAWDKRPRGQSLVITVLIVAAIAVAGVITVWWQWEWLHASEPNTWLPSSWEWLGSREEDGRAYNGDILRNVGFIVAGVVALVFAFWRARVAGRQADAAQEQTATSQQSLLNERYQRGAEMLGSDVLSVRLGGIYALQRLAEVNPEQYHIQIMRLFCAFVRKPPQDGEPSKSVEFRPDVQDVISAIGKRSDAGQRLEVEAGFRLDLSRAHLDHVNMAELNFARVYLLSAHLSGGRLLGANLSGADLSIANLSDASLIGADLSGAYLMRANLSGANLAGADFTGAYLTEANFYRAFLGAAKVSDAWIGGPSMLENLDEAIHPGEYVPISQRQLNETIAPHGTPHIISISTDPETGEPLVWRDETSSSE